MRFLRLLTTMIVALIVGTGFLIAQQSSQEPAKSQEKPKKELADPKAIQGKWEVTGWETGGKEYPAWYKRIYTFDKSMFTIKKDSSEPIEQNYKLGTSGEFDSIHFEATVAEQTISRKGLYQFTDADTLVLCMGKLNKPKYPTGFDSGTKEAPFDVITLKRIK